MSDPASPARRTRPRGGANGPLSTLFPIDSTVESSFGERGVPPSDAMSRWMGWRLRLLVVAALLGCLGLFLLAREMASQPRVDASWRATAENRIELARATDPALGPLVGQQLLAVQADGRLLELRDALTLRPSARWVIGDEQRREHRRLHEELGKALSEPAVQFVFAGGRSAFVQTAPRGFVGLGIAYWLLCALALVLYLVGMVVLMAKPNGRNLLYATLTSLQAGNLVCIAIETTADLALPWPFVATNLSLRAGFDLFSAAAIVHAAALHPRRLPGAPAIAATAWLVAAAITALVSFESLPHGWWWVQGGVLVYGLSMVAMMGWAYRIEPHPFATVLRRFGLVTLATWMLLTASLAAAVAHPGVHQNIASVGSTVWYVFFASLLMLVPFLSRSQQILREFSMLAAVSTVATSLDLLFVAVFSLGPFASLTLALFLSLAVYSGARQWVLNQLLGNSMLTTERMFEQLYRIAREVEAHPERSPVLLSELLRDLFEPMEVTVVQRRVSATRVSSDGSTLIVPVPALGAESAPTQGSIVLRFARRGRRLFNFEDARLTARVVEQLRRAVAFDRAVEQGRSEERARIAQDLHDDIGARLLTLMYKAQSPEMEEYVRHTLQDLKTLTRGLAAANHRLSHAAAEWKADLTQRLTAAHVALDWSFDSDADVLLTVVQWSALTRVLRELVSNAIAHSRATRVEVSLALRKDRFELHVHDNGEGRNPRAWAHGLGLGGVRKRVKQLGGEVEWRELSPRGIGCRVIIREFSSRT